MRLHVKLLEIMSREARSQFPRDALESTISTFVSAWAAFGAPQSIFHCDSEATPATAAESGLFVLW